MQSEMKRERKAERDGVEVRGRGRVKVKKNQMMYIGNFLEKFCRKKTFSCKAIEMYTSLLLNIVHRIHPVGVLQGTNNLLTFSDIYLFIMRSIRYGKTVIRYHSSIKVLFLRCILLTVPKPYSSQFSAPS